MQVDLVGVTEIADLLGVSRQRADQLANSEGFAQPVGEIAAGRIWKREDVEAWARLVGQLCRPSNAPMRSVKCIGGPMEGAVFDTDALTGSTVRPPAADVVYLVTDDEVAGGHIAVVYRGFAE